MCSRGMGVITGDILKLVDIGPSGSESCPLSTNDDINDIRDLFITIRFDDDISRLSHDAGTRSQGKRHNSKSTRRFDIEVTVQHDVRRSQERWSLGTLNELNTL